MADQAITGLPVKTKSGIAATDYMLGIDSAEGYQMLIKDLGDYIIQTVQSNLMGSNQTLAAALSALNSNIQCHTDNVIANDSVSFILRDKDVGRFHYGLIIGGSGTGSAYVGFVFVSNSSGNYAATVTPILNPSNRTVNASYNGSTGVITFTPTANFYGGLRYIDLS